MGALLEDIIRRYLLEMDTAIRSAIFEHVHMYRGVDGKARESARRHVLKERVAGVFGMPQVDTERILPHPENEDYAKVNHIV